MWCVGDLGFGGGCVVELFEYYEVVDEVELCVMVCVWQLVDDFEFQFLLQCDCDFVGCDY